MEQALQPLEPLENPGSRSTRNFALGLAASLALHLVGTVILFSLPQGPESTSSVTYVDLGTVQAPAPVTAPVEQAAPQPVAPQEEPAPLPETPVVEEPAAQETTASLQQAAAAQEAVAAEQKPQTTLGIGLTKGFFESLGSGETLREEIKDYYLEMLQKINEKWWLDPQLQARQRPVVVNITVARTGELVDSSILVSSGDRRYDRAVLAAVAAAGPLPPLPHSYELDFFQAPVRLVPPLYLMTW